MGGGDGGWWVGLQCLQNKQMRQKSQMYINGFKNPNWPEADLSANWYNWYNARTIGHDTSLWVTTRPESTTTRLKSGALYRLVQLVERQSAVREVEGSSCKPDKHSGS